MSTPDPKKPSTAGDAELWQSLRDRGLSEADATRHVLLRRRGAIMNLPAEQARQFLQDVDPGALASFGLGAADMMSFGLGDQAARALEGPSAALTQQVASSQHPAAHTIGEVAGALSPLVLEKALAAVGVKTAPTAIGAAVRGIGSRIGRAAAKTALNATVGATLAGAQAAGRTEGGLPARFAAARRAAPIGGLIGGLIPVGGAALKATVGGPINRFLDALAGSAPGEATLPGGISEASARASLTKQGFSPDVIDQALSQARTPPPPQGLLSEIPGSGGQGFQVTGTRATPPLPTSPTVAEMTGRGMPRQPGLLSSLGKGEQFPYYTRGGAAEQAIAPFPSSASPPASSLIPMQQLQMLLRLSPEEFEAAGGLFPKAIMDQLRQLRLANPGLLAGAP